MDGPVSHLAVRAAVAAAVAALAVTAAGCGDDERSAATAPAAPAAQQVAVGPVEAEAANGMLRGARARRVRAPILMYHVVASPPAGQANAGLWVPRARFAAQMRAVRDAGYQAVTMQQLADAWDTGAPVPEQPVVVTFDDGYLSQSTNAGPVLERMGWPGVLYLTTRNIDSSIPETSVKKLLRQGWELGAHSATHADLRTLDAAGLRREIDDVRVELRARFGQDVRSFCYPAGKYADAAVAAVEDAGYTTATTVEPGWAGPRDPRLLLRRVRVEPTDTPGGLVRKLRAARG